jgi:hypothetical protein
MRALKATVAARRETVVTDMENLLGVPPGSRRRCTVCVQGMFADETVLQTTMTDKDKIPIHAIGNLNGSST